MAPTRMDMIHASLMVMLEGSGVREISTQRPEVEISLVIFYYDWEDLHKDKEAVLAPQRVLQYKLEWRNNDLDLDFQGYLAEGDRLWRMQYVAHTPVSLDQHRLESDELWTRRN
jgi:hypothetical protein